MTQRSRSNQGKGKQKSQVVSMRLKLPQMDRLQKAARKLGYTPSEASALLVEESLRRLEFGHIDFRNSVIGRQAYIQGTSLAVWEVVMIAESYDMDAQKTAAHLEWPSFRVQAALNYAKAFPIEIEDRLADNRSTTFETLHQMIPSLEAFSFKQKQISKASPEDKKARSAKRTTRI
jgi:uncharacterized protein (DUF433 family)